MFGIDEDERNVSTGVVELKLSVLDLPLQPFSGWLYLQDQNKVGPSTRPHPRRECHPGTLQGRDPTVLSDCPNTSIFRKGEKDT